MRLLSRGAHRLSLGADFSNIIVMIQYCYHFLLWDPSVNIANKTMFLMTMLVDRKSGRAIARVGSHSELIVAGVLEVHWMRWLEVLF